MISVVILSKAKYFTKNARYLLFKVPQGFHLMNHIYCMEVFLLTGKYFNDLLSIFLLSAVTRSIEYFPLSRNKVHTSSSRRVLKFKSMFFSLPYQLLLEDLREYIENIV